MSCAAASTVPQGSGCKVCSSPTTSSLIHAVPYSSRAMWARVMASRAVRQPAVLGSRRTPLLTMPATKPLSPAAASVRLRPTVTTCVPLVLMLSVSTWGDG